MTKVNIVVDLIVIVSIGIILMRGKREKRMDLKMQSLFRIMAICLIVILGSDAIAIAVNGKLFPCSRIINLTMDSIFYIAEAVFCFYWVALADYWCFRDAGRLEQYAIIRVAPLMIEVLLILANPFLEWVFRINEANIYERGDFYLVNLIVFYFYFLYAVVLVIKGIVVQAKDSTKRRQNVRMLAYLILPFFGVIYITVAGGFSILWPLVSISVFLASTDEQAQLLMAKNLSDMLKLEQSAELENELTKKSVSLFVRQLQPNFLYNSLAVIRELCDKDVNNAKEAIDKFSDYLRGNMSTLNMEGLISFETELSHIRSYLYLEQLRFRGKLKSKIECPIKDFSVPPLGVLIFVESAVRDGLTMKREGGLVSVTTTEDGENYFVTIADNGNGANPLSIQSEEDSYLGIQTSIQRFDHSLEAKVKVSAVFGEGMTVTITIPKKKKEESPA